MPQHPNTASLLWEPIPYARHGQVMADVPGVGRYLIKRLGKGSREWRAYLNGEPTTLFAGIEDGGKQGVMRKVQERVDALRAGGLNQAAVSTTKSPLPTAADLTNSIRVLLMGGAPPWVENVEQRENGVLCVLTAGRVFEVRVR
jgi:hypothetical protein